MRRLHATKPTGIWIQTSNQEIWTAIRDETLPERTLFWKTYSKNLVALRRGIFTG